MKKFISVILAVVMVLSMSVSAFAEGIDISLKELLELPQGNVKEIRMDYKGEGRSITYPEMFDKYFILCNSVKLTKQEDNTWLDNPVDGLFIEVFMEDDTSCYAYISNDGYVDKYSKFMSRLPAKAYKIANFDADNIIKNLLALGEKPQNKFSGWAKEYVLDSEKSGICSFEDYTLPATRLEFCELLYNAMVFSKALYPTAEYKENKFIDCDNEIVNYFTSLGVISGTGETTFSPDDKIYREEVASIVYRLAKKLNFKGFLEDYRLSSYLFADTDKMSDWAIEAIS